MKNEQKRTEQMLIRVTPKMKFAILNRCLELHTSAPKYIVDLITKDLVKNESKIPAEEKHFIEKKIDEFASQMVTFLSSKIDSKLEKILEYTEPRELQVERILGTLKQYGLRKGLSIKESTENSWKQELSESKDIYQKASEFKLLLDEKIEEMTVRKVLENAHREPQ